MIINEPKKYIGDYAVDSVRGAYENRGNWYYHLVKRVWSRGCPSTLSVMQCVRLATSSMKPASRA